MSSRRSGVRDPWFLALVALLVVYGALFAYGETAADPTADSAMALLFAVIIAVLGGSVLSDADGDRIRLAAGWTLVAAAVAELAALVGVAGAESAASLLLLVGVALYFYDQFLR